MRACVCLGVGMSVGMSVGLCVSVWNSVRHLCLFTNIHIILCSVLVFAFTLVHVSHTSSKFNLCFCDDVTGF